MPNRPPPQLGAPHARHDAEPQVTDLHLIREVYAVSRRPPAASRDWLARGLAVLALSLLGALISVKLRSTAPEAPEALMDKKPIEEPLRERPEPIGGPRPTKVSFAPLDATWSVSPDMTVGDLRFKVFITSSDLSFDFGRIDTLNLAGRPMLMSDTLMTPVFVQSLADCKAMVVLGTASQEGDARVEAQRARDRSDFVQYQVWSTGRLQCPLFTLNLGKARVAQHAGNDPSLTAYQRRLMVVTVLDALPLTLTNESRLRSALHRALGEIKGLPADLVRDYSAFDLERKH